MARKAHLGISKLSEETGINRRTLYKIFDEKGRPSFDLVIQIMESLGMEIQGVEIKTDDLSSTAPFSFLVKVLHPDGRLRLV